MMSFRRLLVRSLAYHRRINWAVALGVAAATAVLTGALLVGDSVRISLRNLALDQLGQVDYALPSDRFFRAALADELQGRFTNQFQSATPVILFPHGTVERQGESLARATQVQIIGCDRQFWELGDVRPDKLPGYDQIVLNQPLADDLNVSVGDQVVVRLPKAAEVPADSALARKTGRVQSVAGLEVIDILPPRSLGRFSLRTNQTEPRIAYLSLQQMQDALDQQQQVNALLVAARVDKPEEGRLASLLEPAFADYGLGLEHAQRLWRRDGQTKDALNYFSVTSDRMVLQPLADQAVAKALGKWDAQPVMTYLANTIARGGGSGRDEGPDDDPDDNSNDAGIPYSTVSGIQDSDAFPIVDVAGARIEQLKDDEILLNRWAAEQLSAAPGDKIVLRYFLPETVHGHTVEEDHSFTLRAIVPLTEPAEPYSDDEPPKFDQAPTPFNDPFLTPKVEGITDEDSIANWDPPFPYDSGRIQPSDEQYWENHRTTPKAFVSLSKARQLWGSRFGQTTSYRVPIRDGLSADQVRQAVAEQLHQQGNRPGFDFIPIRQQNEEAAKGTTPFGGLFLALSFFVIVSALILVSLLFQLGVEQRAGETGTLLAVGMSRKRTARLLSAEGAAVAALGALLGVLLGVGYAGLMVTGLREWWVGAITTPFLRLHMTPLSLALGYVLGVAASVATVRMRLWSMRRLSIRRLLAGEASAESGPRRGARSVFDLVAAVLLAGAVALGYYAAVSSGQAQAGAFVGAGALVLAATLLFSWNRLRGRRSSAPARSIGTLARRNAARNPTRSTLVIGLMAVATFLIVAMSAFRMDPTREGSGGFDLVAESSAPIFTDLSTAAGRAEVLPEPEVLEGTDVLALRVKPGDDASCRNLYRSARPRVLGAPQALIDYYDDPERVSFQFASSAADNQQQKDNPWRLLARDPGPGQPVPAVLDANTAKYSLHVGGVGTEFDVEYEDGTTVTFKIVGLLSNSMLQGSVLIGEAAFERLYEEIGGYRFFLLRVPGTPERQAEVAEALERALGDQGFDARPTEDVLRELLAVQNTYLSTFQSLGLLGLLLGTFGLATVQLRSVFERRRELALMRAAGFRRQQLAGMVLLENVALLVAGLAAGAFSALIAVLPYGLISGAAIPWQAMAWMLGLVLLAGVLTGLLAVRATLRAPLVAALRGE